MTPGRDLRNTVQLECGVCGENLTTCFYLSRFTTACRICGAKFDVVWTPSEVKMTCLSDLEIKG